MTKKPAAASSAAKTAPSTSGVDAGFVRAIAELLSETDLTEIEIEKGDLRIRVAREIHYTAAPHAPQVAMIAAPAPAAAPAAAPVRAATPEVAASDHPGALKSPMVGTAYRRPSPEAAPFVEIGSTVKAGDKLFLVEAMKTFNEIVATRGGVVTAIMVEDGQPVEYGQTLAVIE